MRAFFALLVALLLAISLVKAQPSPSSGGLNELQGTSNTQQQGTVPFGPGPQLLPESTVSSVFQRVLNALGAGESALPSTSSSTPSLSTTSLAQPTVESTAPVSNTPTESLPSFTNLQVLPLGPIGVAPILGPLGPGPLGPGPLPPL